MNSEALRRQVAVVTGTSSGIGAADRDQVKSLVRVPKKSSGRSTYSSTARGCCITPWYSFQST